MRYKFNFLKIHIDHKVAFVTIDNPPINVLTMALLGELSRFAIKAAKDDDISVIVFDSANPDFFIAHFDVNILALAPDVPPPKSNSLQGINPLCEAFRTMPKISIAKIEGICRGGGSEFVLGLDMRFGAIGKARLAQPEIMVGMVVGGGSSQRLPRLMGVSRALEVILGGYDFSAKVAEKYGYINRALPPEEITPFINKLAYRIASYPKDSIALAKKAVLNSQNFPLIEGILEEYDIFNHSLALPATKARMKYFLEEGGQTRELEIDYEKAYEELLEKLKDDEIYF